MFILFALQLALSIWIFVENDNFLNKMNNLVESAWKQNDSANGYPMDALQLSVSKLQKLKLRSILINCYLNAVQVLRQRRIYGL